MKKYFRGLFLFLSTLLLILYSVVSITFSIGNQNPEVTVSYFYCNPCGSCNKQIEITDEIKKLLSTELKETKLRLEIYNTFKASDLQYFKKLCNKYSINNLELSEPSVFINGRLLKGEKVIKQKLKYEFVKEKEIPNTNIHTEVKRTDSLITYFYVSPCKDCEKVNEFMLTLNNEYIVKKEGKFLKSKLIIKKLNVADIKNLEIVSQYFKKYKVPEKEQHVPIIFLRDQYLSSVENIKKNLISEIKDGKAIYSEDAASGLRKSIPLSKTLNPSDFPTIFFTGIINGLNPCSISMLLFFISMIIVRKASVIKLSIAFITAKIITYFALGTFLFSLIQKIDGEFFRSIQNIIKIILIIIMAVVAVLNFLDFIAAKNEKYAIIKLQLPVFFRRFSHEQIKKITAVKGQGFLIFASFMLGIIITVGEFLCTGQIYLLTIIYMVKRSSVLNILTLGGFATYVLAMALPLVILTIAIYKGRQVFEVSELVRKNMQYIKLVNVFVFIAFIFFIIMFF